MGITQSIATKNYIKSAAELALSAVKMRNVGRTTLYILKFLKILLASYTL